MPTRNYRALFDAIDEGFCIVEMIFEGDQAVDYRFLEVNRTFERQTGLVDAVGRTALELVPTLESRWPRLYGEVALSGEPRRFMQGSDAMARWFDVYAFRIGGEGSREVAIVFKDVSTERLALSELREKDRLKDEFLAMLAHELRNPMVPIQASVYLLRESPDAQTAHRVADTIERQMNQLVRLVDDLMEVSRVTRGKVALRTAPFALQEAIDAAAEATSPTFQSSGHRLVLDLPADPVMVDGDAVRLTQVFTNLLNNAAKYSPPGSEVRASMETLGEEVIVSVRDQGIGLPPERLEQVFELFAQLGRRGGSADGGLGIGLTLVRTLVQMHGGSVKAESAGEGKGATFTVRLPRLPAAGSTTEGPKDGSGNLSGLRVLLVDDNRDILDVFSDWLQAFGAQVRECGDGEAALAIAAEWQPQVVMLDLGMPGITGWETATRLREAPGGAQRLLVAISGWGQPQDIERSSRAGFDAHFTKPPPMARLHALLVAHQARIARADD